MILYMSFMYIYLIINLIQLYLIFIEMKHLSEDLKWRVVFSIADGYTQQETSERLYISIGTVNNVYKIYKCWGCVIDPFRGTQGRKKTFNTHDMKVFNMFFFLIFKIIIYYMNFNNRYYKNLLRKRLIGF